MYLRYVCTALEPLIAHSTTYCEEMKQFVNSKFANFGKPLKLGVTTKNSLPSESSENTVLDEIQYGESNGGDRFSIGRSMTKLYA